MNQLTYIKNFSKTVGISILLFLIITLLATVLNYFNLIGIGSMGIFKMIIPIISILVGGIYLGSKAKNKGWLEGIKLSSFLILLLLLCHFIWIKNTFGLKNVLYYVILMISGMVGSMVGINIKRKN